MIDLELLAAVIENMPLEQIQRLLRATSGRSLRCKDDAVYRRELWRRLDWLIRKNTS
jgi:hypothetical protein